MEEKILCAFCSAPFTKEMIDIYNGTYGCESGCEYYSIVVTCNSCKKEIYTEGSFGSFDNEEERMQISEDAWGDIIKNSKNIKIIKQEENML